VRILEIGGSDPIPAAQAVSPWKVLAAGKGPQHHVQHGRFGSVEFVPLGGGRPFENIWIKVRVDCQRQDGSVVGIQFYLPVIKPIPAMPVRLRTLMPPHTASLRFTRAAASAIRLRDSRNVTCSKPSG